MKKLILTLLLIPSLCMAADPIDWSKPYARMGVVTMGAGVAAATTCTTSNDSALVTQDTDNTTQYAITETTWKAQGFQFTSNKTVTEIHLSCIDNTGLGNMIISIYNNNGGIPGSAIADTTVTVAAANIPNTQDYAVFTLATPFVAQANTAYYIVVKTDSGGANDAVYAVTPSAYADGAYFHTSDSGSNWNTYDYDLRFKIMGCN